MRIEDCTEGVRVTATEPHKDYAGEWILPGETLYVLSVSPGAGRLITADRVRVRCPASGADMWVDPSLLEPLEEPVKQEDEGERCPNCDSTHLLWHLGIQNNSPVLDGRLGVHDVIVSAYLGCEECSETVRTLTQDEAEDMFNRTSLL